MESHLTYRTFFQTQVLCLWLVVPLARKGMIIKMNYREVKEQTEVYKKNYVDGIISLIERKQRDAEVVRREYSKNIFITPQKYRDDLKKMFGWPLAYSNDCFSPECIVEKLSQEEGYSIYRMQFEILEGLKMTGLFFRTDTQSKRPLVITQHGGVVTPEYLGGLYVSDDNYNGMLHRVLQHGVHVFAPQLLLWKEDYYDIYYNRKEIDGRLKRIGSSITAVELYGIQRILKIMFLRLEW